MSNPEIDTDTGIPDRWMRIWAPHRAAYLSGENRPLPTNEVPCPFCEIPKKEDAAGLIVHRGKSLFVVLNLYPYNPGHLLICTYRHISDFTELENAERNELSELTDSSMKALREVSKPVGFNIGINQGEFAGAGIPAHFHQHIVPRWKGDANFMPVVSGTKVISQMLDEVRNELVAVFKSN